MQNQAWMDPVHFVQLMLILALFLYAPDSKLPISFTGRCSGSDGGAESALAGRSGICGNRNIGGNGVVTWRRQNELAESRIFEEVFEK